jgi:hypothetical protein
VSRVALLQPAGLRSTRHTARRVTCTALCLVRTQTLDE